MRISWIGWSGSALRANKSKTIGTRGSLPRPEAEFPEGHGSIASATPPAELAFLREQRDAACPWDRPAVPPHDTVAGGTLDGIELLAFFPELRGLDVAAIPLNIVGTWAMMSKAGVGSDRKPASFPWAKSLYSYQDIEFGASGVTGPDFFASTIRPFTEAELVDAARSFVPPVTRPVAPVVGAPTLAAALALQVTFDKVRDQADTLTWLRTLKTIYRYEFKMSGDDDERWHGIILADDTDDATLARMAALNTRVIIKARYEGDPSQGVVQTLRRGARPPSASATQSSNSPLGGPSVQNWYLPDEGGLTTPAIWPDPAIT